MDLKKKLLILGILVSGFVFTVSFATLYAQTNILEGTACTCTLPIPILIPTFASFGFLVGLISFYLFLPLMARRRKKDINLFLEILDPMEREVLRMLINNKGEISQAQISKKLGKVRAFRAIEKLRRRGILEKEKRKKTNLIKLSEKYLDLSEE